MQNYRLLKRTYLSLGSKGLSKQFRIGLWRNGKHRDVYMSSSNLQQGNQGNYYGLGIYVGWGWQGMHTEFWYRNLLENVQLEGREGYGRITLRFVLWKYVVRMVGGWNWLGIVFIGCSLFSISSVEPLFCSTKGLFQFRFTDERGVKSWALQTRDTDLR
jgi:hypothetical protein